MKHCYPFITSPPLRHRMAVSLNNLRHRWVVKCTRENFFAAARRDMIRLGIHEMARLEQALDNDQDKCIERNKT